MRALGVLVVLVIGLAPFAVRADGWRDRLAGEPRVRALASADRSVRIDAARWLGRHGDPERAIEALIDALGTEREPDVRVHIADALARRRDPRAIAVLTAEVAGMRPNEHDARLGALAAIDAAPAREALAAALGGPGAALAFPRIVELGAPMLEALTPLLDVPGTATLAARALGRIGDPRAVDALAPHAADLDTPLRATVLEALGEIGDARALPIAIAALDDPEIAVVVAALRSITLAARDGIDARDASDAVASALERDEPSIAIAALDALARIDPRRAVPHLERALAGDDGALAREAARRAVLDAPDVAFVPLLVVLGRGGGEGCDALGRVEDGGGIAALVELARGGSGDARLAIAIALRGGSPGDAIEALRGESDGPRRELLLAIARDRDVATDLARRVEHGTSEERTIAAQNLELLGFPGDEARRALETAIATERDAIALEALARALDAAGGSIDPAIPTALVDPALSGPRLILATIARRPGSAEIARELRQISRDGLRAPEPRVRSGAALALARTGAISATIAIASGLEDSAPEVRLAAARALSILGALARPSIAERVASRLAIESDARVRRALRDALASTEPSPRAVGERCLVLRLDRPRASSPVAIEVVLDDGRWLRERTLGTGELVICDLPSGDADVLLPP